MSTYINKNNQKIYFEQISPTTIQMSGYDNLQVTEDAGRVMCVDPPGGPMICIDTDMFMISMDTVVVEPVMDGIVSQLTVNDGFVIITTKPLERKKEEQPVSKVDISRLVSGEHYWIQVEAAWGPAEFTNGLFLVPGSEDAFSASDVNDIIYMPLNDIINWKMLLIRLQDK